MPFLPFVYGYPSSCPRTQQKPPPTKAWLLCATPAGMDLYTGHACRHLSSAVPWISEDRLLDFWLGGARASRTLCKADVTATGWLNCLVPERSDPNRLRFAKKLRMYRPLVKFMYLVFTRVPGESYCRRLRSLLLYLCYVFRALLNSLVCWFRLEKTA